MGVPLRSTPIPRLYVSQRKNIMQILKPREASASDFLSRAKAWAYRNRTDLLIRTIPTIVILVGTWIVGLVAKSILAAPSVLAALGELMLLEAALPVWGLLLLATGPLVLLLLIVHALLYRYRQDEFCGVIWKWGYSFPLGHVKRVRALCRKCEKIHEEPGIYFRSDNLLCDRCGHSSRDGQAENMPHHWRRFIQAKVDERKASANQTA
jgi:hypothetical protein